jgi:hypothetical protein
MRPVNNKQPGNQAVPIDWTMASEATGRVQQGRRKTPMTKKHSHSTDHATQHVANHTAAMPVAVAL